MLRRHVIPPLSLPPIKAPPLSFLNSHEKRSLFHRGNLTATMSTALLPSHGCLSNRFHRESFASRPPPPRKKPLRSPPRQKPKSKPSSPRKPPANGQVSSLKRDEPLKPSPAVDLRSYGEDSSGLSSIYAGPACSVSPEPSSLPFPAFFVKNEMATRGLRCLLRLDQAVA